MTDVCSATVADARRLRAQMGWSPSSANQRRKCYRAAQILRTEAIMNLSSVPSGPQGYQPGTSRRALLKHIMALCIVIFEFEIGSNKAGPVNKLWPFLVFTVFFTFFSCPSATAQRSQAGQKIFLGIDVLKQDNFRPLRGKRVGLLTHPAGVDRNGVSTIEILRRSAKVNLVALFGPEHGLYGDEKANQPVEDRIDRRTGLPVYSLYGKFRWPTDKMLKGLDVMVIDLQDLGVRSYTYISAMRYTMEACFKNKVEVVILDRPNPLGGRKVDGPLMEAGWKSYVGAYRIPYVYGLTIGELALMAKGVPGWLEVSKPALDKGKLTVVPMKGWNRDKLWTDTGLRWIPTSPAIPDLSAALGYSMTGLGAQIGGFQHGYGSQFPFRLLTFPGKDPREIADALKARQISGIDYMIVDRRTSRGRQGKGVYLVVKDYSRLRPTEISFHMMQLACQWSAENPFAASAQSQARLFNIHVGSTEWWDALGREGARVDVAGFLRKWQTQSRVFQAMSRKYWLYP